MKLGLLKILKVGLRPYLTFPQCLKITEKVSFDIASEASYVYILSEQKFIKKSQKMINFYSCQTVLPVRPFLIDKNDWQKNQK